MHHIVAPGFVDRPRRSDCTAGQMDGEAGWWTTSGNIGLPPLARVMGVGRQQQQRDYRRMACHKRVFSPQLFNIYTNYQPVHDGTRIFIYADDLCITAQFPTFSQVKSTIEEEVGELTEYYRNNSLRANPDKMQATAFHLRDREAKISLKI